MNCSQRIPGTEVFGEGEELAELETGFQFGVAVEGVDRFGLLVARLFAALVSEEVV